MTGMVGRSDGPHPEDAEACSLLPLSANHFLSLNGGRSLRSLAYAPFGARRSRTVRAASQPGPCHGRRLVGSRARSFIIPQAPGARSARLATRHSARGAVAPSGLLRSPVPVSGERLVGCRARRLLSRSPGRRPGARDCAPRRMARKPSERSERPAPEGNETLKLLHEAELAAGSRSLKPKSWTWALVSRSHSSRPPPARRRSRPALKPRQ